MSARWRSNGHASTVLVAASNAPSSLRDGADYVCDGVADEVQINQAISSGKHVQLSAGLFTIAAPLTGFVSGGILSGTGMSGAVGETGTRILCASSFSGSNAIDVRSSSPGSTSLFAVTLRNFYLDGYGAGSPYTNANGIKWGVANGFIQNVNVARFKLSGIVLDGGGSAVYPLGAWDNFITNSTAQITGDHGVVFQNGASDNTITACQVNDTTDHGFYNTDPGNRFVGCYTANCGDYAYYSTGAGACEVGIFSFRIRDSKGGIYLAPSGLGCSFVVSGGSIRGGTLGANNTYDGIVVAPSSTSTGGTISGVTFENYATDNTLRYGINIGANASGVTVHPWSANSSNMFGTAAFINSGANTFVPGSARESFRAYLNSTQSISASSETVVAFDSEDWDVDGRHDSVTNKGRYTPKVAGYYRISASISWSDSISDQERMFARVKKNGSAEAFLCDYQSSGATGNNVMWGSALVQANGTTDYFEISVFHNHATSRNLSTGRTAVYWCAELVGQS